MKRTLFLIVLFVVAVVAHARDHVYVVSVGINKYKYAKNLTLSETDAGDFANLTGQFKNVTVTRVMGSRATRANIIDAMKRAYASAAEDDVVMLFFSGHGVTGGLCPYDMTSNGRGKLTYKDISAVMKSCRAKRKIIITDACHSGSGRLRSSNRNSSSSTSSTIKKANIILFMSSRDNEYSMEYSNMKNSIFTHYLMHGLAGSADVNNDRQVTAREIFNYVSNNVKSKTNNAQHPVMWGNFDENFVFITY